MAALHEHHPGEDHSHVHAGHGHAHARDAGEMRLQAALALLFAFTLVEGIGGWWANSIALLAEAAHMLADCVSLLLAIVAIRLGRRPANAARTYGHRRYQTLAAYTNGLTLLALSIWVVAEAAHRLIAPPTVDATLMLTVAVAGAVANLAAFMVLAGASSLNERGARAHVLSDLLGSGAAIAAACAILAFGWLLADPLLSIAISVLILRSGWQLTRESAHVLLQGAPEAFDVSELQSVLTQVPGVCGIHHVHAWSLTGEAPIVTLHAELFVGVDRQRTLTAILDQLSTRFGVEHATVQIEEGQCAAPVEHCHDPFRPVAR
jgi:cobalt-zinc-cadmium efflux system protein